MTTTRIWQLTTHANPVRKYSTEDARCACGALLRITAEVGWVHLNGEVWCRPGK